MQEKREEIEKACTSEKVMYLNALLNHRYMDDSRDENDNKALINILDNIHHGSIIVADRNYKSYNNIAHFESKGWKYVIHIRSKHGIMRKFNLPIDKKSTFP